VILFTITLVWLLFREVFFVLILTAKGRLLRLSKTDILHLVEYLL